MTAVLNPPVTVASVPASPAARRRPVRGLRDGRLIVGIVLVLGSVVVGARVVSSAASTITVLALKKDLPAGHVLSAADLTPRQVHLDGVTAIYVAATSRVSGQVTTRALGAGELLPRGALGRAAAADEAGVPLSVDAGRAPDLAAGDVVDVWSTFATAATSADADDGSSGGDKGCVTVPVARGLEVTALIDATGTDRAVVLRVPAEEAGALVHAAATTTVVLTLHAGGGSDAPRPTSQIGGITPVGPCGATR